MRSGRIPATLIHAIMPLRTNKPLIASFSRLVKQKRLFYSFCQYPIAHTHVTDHGITAAFEMKQFNNVFLLLLLLNLSVWFGLPFAISPYRLTDAAAAAVTIYIRCFAFLAGRAFRFSGWLTFVCVHHFKYKWKNIIRMKCLQCFYIPGRHENTTMRDTVWRVFGARGTTWVWIRLR